MMRVRCGRCGTEFTVPGPGRYACPSCDAMNEIRPRPGHAGFEVPSSPPPVSSSPRLTCSACGFSFIVGDIEVAVCPNCGERVSRGGDG